MENNQKNMKFVAACSFLSLLCGILGLVMRYNAPTNIYLANAPAYKPSPTEWRIGKWPHSANLLTIDEVVHIEQQRNPNFTKEDVESLIAQKKIEPEPLPIEVTFTDVGISKSYTIKQ
jgi:hypothetical protein